MASEIIYALLGGILPALLWLIFWLREDWRQPEPNRLILKTFLFGMAAVIFVLPFQKGVEIFFPAIALSILLWAVLEEVFKFAAGYYGGIHTIEDNEPLDPSVYMITAALGFVALENTLFIAGPLLGDNIPQTIVTANLRFIGASLLHVVASGIVGASISFSFYRDRATKKRRVMFGLLGAIGFHALFNFLILSGGTIGTHLAFASVWIGVVVLLLTFERIKSLQPIEKEL